MKNEKEKIGVDLVYLWVDGNDPAWQTKYAAFANSGSKGFEINCKGRYADNDELKYSLRSVEMYAPWIRKIFIVTDNQVPEWLDTSNPKVQIVDHTEIMPEESLPCFNSCLIEHYLYRIPGLAEHFLYSNDDMFINKNVTISDFFTSEGFPIIRLAYKPFLKIRWFWREHIRKKPLKNYSKKIALTLDLVYEKYGIYYSAMPHHNIDAYLRSDLQKIAEEVMRDEFNSSIKHHMRSNDDVQRSVFSYVALAEKRGLVRYVSNTESMYVKIHKIKYYQKLVQYNPLFFCMNDSEYVTNDDRVMMKIYLEKRFPKKSLFEK